MPLADALLPEFDHEAGVTRRLLERLPDGQFAWTPHQKSMPLGRLAAHVAEVLTWLPETVHKAEIDWDSTKPNAPRVYETRADVLRFFDESRDAARSALAGASDAELMQTWTFKKDGRVVFSMPRIGIIRSMVMNHLIHHRAQLGVYLRLQNIPLPAMYGPSADEGGV
jgi:uncharacterized damage-inducible protein DinB